MPRGGTAGDRETTSCRVETTTNQTSTRKSQATGESLRRRGRVRRAAIGAVVLFVSVVGPALASSDVAAGSGGSGAGVGAILATTVAAAMLSRRR